MNEKLNELYRKEGWGVLAENALDIEPADVESAARRVARYVCEPSCPFCRCGDLEQRHIVTSMAEGNVPKKVIQCTNCKARGPEANDMDDAIRGWNTRV